MNGQSYGIKWFTYDPAGQANACLVPISNLGCDSGDFKADVSGKVYLISRGQCDFGLKVALAGAAGASGAIVYNNVPEALLSVTLGQPSRPQMSALTFPVAASAAQMAVNEQRYTNNVLATTKLGDRGNVVMAGGHTDSVPAGPGINDNGSGSMGILEIALQLAKFKVTNAVRFGFWTAEEFGLVGADQYVSSLTAEEQQEIALYLNFDMIASPNFGYFIYDGDGSTFNLTGPPASDAIEHLFEDYFKANGIVSGSTEFDGRSDYGPFLEVNIPSGGLFTGAEGIKTEAEASQWGGQANTAYDSCYHQSCDTIQNLNTTAWVVSMKTAAHAIANYSTSLDGIPRTRNTMSRKVDRQKQLKACGHDILAM
ncbi:hypothetical protein AMATHDRAFT_42756 [Amanita thiersii Skay4041]|uniref:Peptide hydrolase n=1 Tax=Amanita thiersii Skay4041 TaxID=703135 RepID=A0A2A9NIU9_9AGAR|nr:hypothetical protein AMATHDRAFT_42756 [Amanita thiersii Skay4041]